MDLLEEKELDIMAKYWIKLMAMTTALAICLSSGVATADKGGIGQGQNKKTPVYTEAEKFTSVT